MTGLCGSPLAHSICVKQLNKTVTMFLMSKTYLWLHNIEKDFYKLVQLLGDLQETFTTTPAQHVTTSDLQVLWGLKHGMDG